MFGNALLFLSNPFFNECFRVDAAFSKTAEKFKSLGFVKTLQGYLFDDDNNPCYDFDNDETEHESLNLLNERCFFINLDAGVLDDNFSVLIEFEDSDKMSVVNDILHYMQGQKTTQNLQSIFTIYFD